MNNKQYEQLQELKDEFNQSWEWLKQDTPYKLNISKPLLRDLIIELASNEKHSIDMLLQVDYALSLWLESYIYIELSNTKQPLINTIILEIGDEFITHSNKDHTQDQLKEIIKNELNGKGNK